MYQVEESYNNDKNNMGSETATFLRNGDVSNLN